jgi:hypothetical protein
MTRPPAFDPLNEVKGVIAGVALSAWLWAIIIVVLGWVYG